MVNLKKIGAVATGALFVGATIGMASAATVPSVFEKSMLADSSGAATAQLVVGKDAPGKAEDKASAEIIQGAVADALGVSGTGGQIKIEYGDENLDQKGAKDDFALTSLSAIGSGNTVTINGSGLLFDANGDGDVKDSGDYTLYDAVYVSDDIGGTIRFAYNLSAYLVGAYDGNQTSLLPGVVTEVKGSKYAITDISDLGSGEISLGPAIAKTIYDGGPTANPDNAVVIAENYKVFLKNMTGDNPTLMFYEGNSLLAQYTNLSLSGGPKKLNDIEGFDAGGLEDKYNIYLVETGTDTVSMTFVDKDQIIDLVDEDTGVMGYDLVWVNNTDNWPDGVALLSQVVQLVKDETIDLEGTYYQLKYTTSRKLDIKRKETKTQSSGTKWKDSKNDFLNDDVWISATGGQIKIEYGDENLDQQGANDDFNLTSLSSIGSGNTTQIGGDGLLFDANGDGDVKDSGDYTLYDAVYVSDDIGGTIRFAYNLSAHLVSSYDADNSTLQPGVVTEVKGSKYAITDISDFSSNEISLGPAIAKTIYNGGSTADPDNAVVIAENYKVFYKVDSNSGTLMFYEGNSLLAQYSNLTEGLPKELNDIEGFDAGGLEDKYKIYIVENGTDTVSMSFVDKDLVDTLVDEDTGVMGYDLVWVNNQDNWPNGVALLSQVVQLVKDETIDFEGTYYQLKYTNARKLDIKRKETKTQSSGTKWKSSKNDFLNDDIYIDVTGGETVTPSLDIVDEDGADKDMNLVLVGGPVANALTAELETSGKSTVNWEESDGDVEVVADAFTTGKTAVIVAGKTRAETKAAAELLANAL